MDSVERDVARHYTHGALDRAIAAGLSAAAGASVMTIDALAAVDEFHMGGREATAALVDKLDLDAHLSVLDIGCGLGGTARYLASRFGRRVTGVDLTAEYIEVGNALNRRLGFDDRVHLQVASATDLPFEDATFDRATLLHVGMNIADKRRQCAEAARVIRPGGLFAVYDVMRTGDGALTYPVAWAQSEVTSFIGTPNEYANALSAAGFDIIAQRDRRELALEFFQRMKRRVAEAGPPPLGLHILMGGDAPTKVANLIDNLESGRIAPIEMIAKRR